MSRPSAPFSGQLGLHLTFGEAFEEQLLGRGSTPWEQPWQPAPPAARTAARAEDESPLRLTQTLNELARAHQQL